MTLRRFFKLLLPPGLGAALNRFNGLRLNQWRHEWTCLGPVWPPGENAAAGWDNNSVVDIERARMREFAAVLAGRAPLTDNLAFHNTYMVFGTVLGLAAQGRREISFLDYGGGAGRYFMLARTLQPGLGLGYTCKEVPALCELGAQLHPAARYLATDDACFDRKYDLVMASTSLHYAQDWRGLAARLAGATSSYLLVTRLPVVRTVASYVVRQRPYRYGYRTDYVCWFINRTEFLHQMESLGMELVREFLLQEQPRVVGAPEQCEYIACLFRPRTTAPKETP